MPTQQSIGSLQRCAQAPEDPACLLVALVWRGFSCFTLHSLLHDALVVAVLGLDPQS